MFSGDVHAYMSSKHCRANKSSLVTGMLSVWYVVLKSPFRIMSECVNHMYHDQACTIIIAPGLVYVEGWNCM